MQDRIDDYLSTLQLERGRSLLTIESYESTLKAAATMFAKLGRHDWASVTKEDATAWVHSLGRQAPRTLMRKLAALRGLARHMVRAGSLADDFTALLSSPKLDKPLPRALTQESARRVVEAFNGADQYSVRNRAILELFYGSGLRATEVCTVPVGGVDFSGGMVRVIGKGNKERITPVNEATMAAIRRYVEMRPKFVKGGTPEALFLSDRGRQMSRHQVWCVVREASLRSGLESKPESETNPAKKRRHRVHPHVLRHSFGTHLLHGGADVRAVQVMLGHESVATTQIYTKVDARQMMETHTKFHPRNQEHG
jgi:integrase/recombinase XerD